MSLKDKMKTYNFWISLVSAVVLIVRIIGDKFNFIVDTSLIMDITTGLCSIFVILGILSVPKTKTNSDNNTTETTPKENIENIISNINSSREILKTMDNQISQISNQDTINVCYNEDQNNQNLDTTNNCLKDQNTDTIETTNLEQLSCIDNVNITNNNIPTETTIQYDDCKTNEQTIDSFDVEPYEQPTVEDLSNMVQALKENFDAITRAFDLYYKQNN